MTDSSRDAAYIALVDALIALRQDPATQRFDEYLDYAESTSRIDAPTARALRWWQRQSVRGLADHLEEVLPGLLVALERADAAAKIAVDENETAWRAAAQQSQFAAQSSGEPAAQSTAQSSGEPAAQSAAHMAGPDKKHDVEAPAHEAQTMGAHSFRPEALEPQPTQTPSYYSEYPSEVMESHRPDVGAPDQRTFVAGLNVIPDGLRER